MREGARDDAHPVRLRAGGGAGLRSRRRPCAARAKTGRGRAKTARQGGGGRAAGAARRRFAQRGEQDFRAFRARRAPAVRPAGRARRDPRTDRARDVPALRALSMARTRKPEGELDLDLEDLPAPARWREWMARVEAVIFASAEPVSRESLARVVGKACNLELDPRRHPRGVARAALRNRLRRRRLELSHEAGLRRRDPRRARRRANDANCRRRMRWC